MFNYINPDRSDVGASGSSFAYTLNIENVTSHNLYVFGRGGLRATVPPSLSSEKREGIYFSRNVVGGSNVELTKDSDYRIHEPKGGSNPNYRGKRQGKVVADDYYHVAQVNGNQTGLLYIQKLDIALSFKDFLDDDDHPFRNDGIIDRALSERGDIIDSASARLGFMLVNSKGTNIGPRYINVGGQVFSINPSTIEGLEPGLHVLWDGAASLSGDNDTIGKKVYPLSEIDKKDFEYRLFRTYEEATDEAQAAIKERELLEQKRRFEEEKLERDLIAAARKDEYEQRSIERKDTHEERSNARKDYYDERNADRKDSADALKWIIGIAGVGFAVFKSGTKFAAIASSGFTPAGIALGTVGLLAQPPTILAQAATCTASVVKSVVEKSLSVVGTACRFVSRLFSW